MAAEGGSGRGALRAACICAGELMLLLSSAGVLLLGASPLPAPLGLAAFRGFGAAAGVAAATAARRSSAAGAGRCMAGLLPRRSAACGVCARRAASLAPAPPRYAWGVVLGLSATGAITSGGGGSGAGAGAAAGSSGGAMLLPTTSAAGGATAGPGVLGLDGRGLDARAMALSLLA